MRAKKDSAEYVRGYGHGFAAAREIATKYWRGMAEQQADDLARNARKRDADAFDKGYATGYRDFLHPPTKRVRAHATKQRALPGVSKWSMTAGGTGAAEGKHGYTFTVPEGTYRIWPYTTRLGRHAGYALKFSAEGGGRPRGSHGGLWHDLGSHASPAKAAREAAEHYSKGFE